MSRGNLAVSALRPYFKRGNITIYHGDCRTVLPQLKENTFDAVITDPVWPNCPKGFMTGSDDPAALFEEVAAHLPRLTKRLVIQLGCNSDPRFLGAIPDELPFFRTCWLEYVRPHYRGRLLYTSDVAYVFGAPPRSRIGARVLPGKILQTRKAMHESEHPAPRHPEHVAWLFKWYADGPVLDPFMGSGTSLDAALSKGVPHIGTYLEPWRSLFGTSRKESLRRSRLRKTRLYLKRFNSLLVINMLIGTAKNFCIESITDAIDFRPQTL